MAKLERYFLKPSTWSGEQLNLVPSRTRLMLRCPLMSRMWFSDTTSPAVTRSSNVQGWVLSCHGSSKGSRGGTGVAGAGGATSSMLLLPYRGATCC
eukprot:GHRQ01012956.1.p1 GENE.GHRQ01012956.1~~GHRQ01012956.1.p1  ORF type:complete len:107 (-),score=7.99 GHRQ01012956.1:256-543(-)